ncbi:MAG: flavodoxin domain-containing protein [Acutalibacteraceae bacterium]|nr:flavodoxin domain-containing protein [Acutalibacteraceae bacterium]
MKISNDIIYVGINDEKIDLFEGQYKVEKGMAYNSYVILDEKIAVMDTVEASFCDQWLNNIEKALGGRKPDYLVVQHMEPDHSANIKNFLTAYPEAVVVGNAKTFKMIELYFGEGYENRRMAVSDGDTLSLGNHILTFVFAPMVHWPEVMMTYDSADKVLFSADGFGKFGVTYADEEWADEARRYYIGIVGKYGAQVQAVLKKAAALEISAICPLHGPVISENLGYYLDLYDKWSSYTPEEEGVVIAYNSIYGNTKKAALYLRDKLSAALPVKMFDLSRDDKAEAIAQAFRFSKLVLAGTTYNNSLFPCMKEFIDGLTERNYQNRTVAFIENGSWAPTSAKNMKLLFEKSKNITFCETTVTVKAALSDESRDQLDALVNELI